MRIFLCKGNLREQINFLFYRKFKEFKRAENNRWTEF